MSYQNDGYDAFIGECIKHCTCVHAPCGGVMSGGFCDDDKQEDLDCWIDDESQGDDHAGS